MDTPQIFMGDYIKDFVFVIQVILFFSFGLFYFAKVSNHLEYLKKIYPHEFEKNFRFVDYSFKDWYIPTFWFPVVMFPFFFNKKKELEINDFKLRALSKKIIRQCYLTWLTLGLFILLLVLM
jgi:hypothetical protein